MSTTTTVTFSEMRKTLQRMFGNGIMDHSLSGNISSGVVKCERVKSEPVLQASVNRLDTRPRGFRPRYGSRWTNSRRRWPRGQGGGSSKCF